MGIGKKINGIRRAMSVSGAALVLLPLLSSAAVGYTRQ
jgi:hypothetical protein